ncbi:hypothetical protein DVW07_17010, partial [Clostridium botulinum]|uniref:hypothetical protein n=1 Tax=Clostridium botulinum TaxID=1491 RepID=UPI0019676C9E
ENPLCVLDFNALIWLTPFILTFFGVFIIISESALNVNFFGLVIFIPTLSSILILIGDALPPLSKTPNLVFG